MILFIEMSIIVVAAFIMGFFIGAGLESSRRQIDISETEGSKPDMLETQEVPLGDEAITRYYKFE